MLFTSDQLFGVILETVLKRTPFQSKSELIELLRDKLALRVAAKGETLHVEPLIAIREFWSWLQPIGVTLHNAFVSREHIAAPHAFSYKLRRSLAPREQRQLQQLGGRGARGCDDDVLCVYKTWMHSTDLKGPLLVLPVDRRGKVETHCPQTVEFRLPLTAAEATELTTLADVLERPQYNLHEGAAALREFVAGHADYHLPPTEWLSSETVDCYGAAADSGSKVLSHLPDTRWDLLATFHRV